MECQTNREAERTHGEDGPVAPRHRIVRHMEFSKTNREDDLKAPLYSATKVQEGTRSPYNFSKASSRDDIVYAACRPGHAHPREGLIVTPRGPPTKVEPVAKWVDFMKDRGIKRVLCLLTRSELTFYSESLLAQYRKLFANDDVVETVSDIYSKDARKRILEALDSAARANEKIVIHCSAGQSRSGACCALWLHHRYKLPIDEAVDEVNSFASRANVYRQATGDALLKMLSVGGQIVSGGRGSKVTYGNNNSGRSVEPATAIAPHTPRYDLETPRSARPLPKTVVAFVQMGGTIDKDYPAKMGGYAFEIGDSAAKSMLRTIAHVPLNINAEHYECCKKDSTDITKEDLNTLSKLLARIKARKIIITHGSDTILSTASFLGKIASLADKKVVVLTCAMRPYKFTNSDASFNIGTAVGAANCLNPGIYIAMGGCIFSHDRCVRDARTGAFVAVP